MPDWLFLGLPLLGAMVIIAIYWAITEVQWRCALAADKRARLAERAADERWLNAIKLAT